MMFPITPEIKEHLSLYVRVRNCVLNLFVVCIRVKTDMQFLSSLNLQWLWYKIQNAWVSDRTSLTC